MMACDAPLLVGVEHGSSCTCRRLEPVTVTMKPVIVDRECPAQGELPSRTKVAGAVTVTWPATGTHLDLVDPREISIHDAVTGQELTTVVALRMACGTSRSWGGEALVELTELVDVDGQVARDPRQALDLDDHGHPRTLTRTFLLVQGVRPDPDPDPEG